MATINTAIGIDEAMAELRCQLESAKERCAWLEQAKKTEYDTRLAAERSIAKLEVQAADAAENARIRLIERDDAMRQLSFAQGYIAALKGEPYQQKESYSEGSGLPMPPYFPSIVRSAR